MGWFANGLPREGKQAATPRVMDIARRDVPTCRRRERVGEVAQRARKAGWDLCVVVDDQGVVLGPLDGAALGGDLAGVSRT